MISLPITGPCTNGLALSSATSPAGRFSKDIANGSSILVFYATNPAGIIHTAPTDNYSNTYNLIGESLTGATRISAWLASNVTGGADFEVTGHNSGGDYGIVCIPLYGNCTYNNDFLSGSGTGTAGSVGPTVIPPPVNSIAFKAVTTFNPAGGANTDSDSWYTPFYSYQTVTAIGRDLYSSLLPVTEVFSANWTFGNGSVDWNGITFSLVCPPQPEATRPAGLVQSLFCKTNTTNSNDDGSDFESFIGLSGPSGSWSITPSGGLAPEEYHDGSHCWNIRSRVIKLYVKVLLANAAGALCTRTYTIRVNGIDTDMSITLSGTSSADGTVLSGSNLINFADVFPNDMVSLHRTGSGGDAGYDVTHWALSLLNNGNRTSAVAMYRTISNNSFVSYFSPLSWKGDQINSSSRQSTTSDLNALSLLCFSGTITRWDLTNPPTIPRSDPSHYYTLVIYKNGIAQDGTGGTPDTTLIVVMGEVYIYTEFELEFEIGDYLQVKSDPFGFSNTIWNMSFRIESDTDGVYGYSYDWAEYDGPDDASSFGGLQQVIGTEDGVKLHLIGPVTVERMNILRTEGTGPGMGNTHTYALMKDGLVGLIASLTGAEDYELVEGSVPYSPEDENTLAFRFTESGSDPGDRYIMALSMLGEIITPIGELRSGMYFLDYGKRNDTVWIDAAIGTEEDVKIP